MKRTFESIKDEVLNLIRERPNATPQEIGTELRLSRIYTYKILYILLETKEINMDVDDFYIKEQLYLRLSATLKDIFNNISEDKIDKIYKLILKELLKGDIIDRRKDVSIALS